MCVCACLCVPSSHFCALLADSFGGDHDAAAAQQTKLLLLSRRLCGVIVGRGMLTMASLPSTATEVVTPPPITLAAKLSPSGVVVTLDTAHVRVALYSYPFDLHSVYGLYHSCLTLRN